MPATPAEVANDLAAQAKFFVKRDDALAKLCAHAARLIRAKAAGEPCDDRSYGDVMNRMLTYIGTHSSIPQRDTQITKSLRRAVETLQTLRAA